MLIPYAGYIVSLPSHAVPPIPTSPTFAPLCSCDGVVSFLHFHLRLLSYG